ncbi:hypothetical protein Hanom_Chr04g00316971 [Helianthus anomalus]
MSSVRSVVVSVYSGVIGRKVMCSGKFAGYGGAWVGVWVGQKVTRVKGASPRGGFPTFSETPSVVGAGRFLTFSGDIGKGRTRYA